MKPVFKLAMAAALGLALAPSGASAQKVTLNVITAGDQNMVDYVKDYLGPIFEKQMPNVSINSVGTGPGDAGSQKIAEKIMAQKDRATWDVDVAVIHQKMAGDLVQAGLLAQPFVRLARATARRERHGQRHVGERLERLDVVGLEFGLLVFVEQRVHHVAHFLGSEHAHTFERNEHTIASSGGRPTDREVQVARTGSHGGLEERHDHRVWIEHWY